MERTKLPELVKNRLFFGLTEQQLDEILPCVSGEEKLYRTGETILRRGDSLSTPGIVLEGALSLCNCDRSSDCGSEPHCAINVIEQNKLFGEVAAFSTDRVVSCDIVAAADTKILYLSPDFFLSSCGKACPNLPYHQAVIKNMFCLISDKATELGRKVEYLSAPDLRTRIAMYLCDLYDAAGSDRFTLPLNRDALASFFLVARPSLSREMVRLKELGLIDFERSRVTVLKPDELRAITRRI